MKHDTFALIDDLVIKAAEVQSGTEITPIRLIENVRLLRPNMEIVTIDQLINNLAARALGRIDEDGGERLFYIDHWGKAYAEEVMELRRPKSTKEKLGQITRSDWIAFAALVVSIVALLTN